jgi:hypothetical protein
MPCLIINYDNNKFQDVKAINDTVYYIFLSNDHLRNDCIFPILFIIII